MPKGSRKETDKKRQLAAESKTGTIGGNIYYYFKAVDACEFILQYIVY